MKEYLKRIADSLERAFPLEPDISFFEKSAAFIWEADQNQFTKVTDVQTVDISLLKGMDKEIEKELWKGKIAVVIKLHKDDVTSLEESPPLLVRV